MALDTHDPGLTRVAMVSLHTSPLERPGTGDAGGLNVYVAETATRLARRGVEVEVFTRATDPAQPPSVELAPGVRVHQLGSGTALDKTDLPGHLEEFGEQLATRLGEPGTACDVIHSHYWLSGVAALQVPGVGPPSRRVGLVHTMHTMARVKNLALAPGDRPEPVIRQDGEERVVAAADALVVNTATEAEQLVELYDAAPEIVHVVPPGVALETFRPGRQDEARRAVGVPQDAVLLLFVGRIQPLKAPDVLVRAAGELLRREPGLRDDLVVAVLGGPSGSGRERPEALAQLVEDEGLTEVVRLGGPVPRPVLADWYRAADVVVVPSHQESFGLVAVEALACGTPVVATRVGGLPAAVGAAGILVDGHDPATWADALQQALAELARPGARQEWSRRAVDHAEQLTWEHTVDALLDIYHAVVTR